MKIKLYFRKDPTQLCFIRILPRDRVKIEVSHYDLTRGHRIYTLHNKDSND